MRTRFMAVLAILMGTLAWSDSQARAGAGDDESGFHFDIGLGGVTGMDHVDRADRSEFDTLSSENSNSASGGDGGPLSKRSDEMPVGPVFDAYYMFNFGLGLGGGIGPMTIGDVRIRDHAAGTEAFDRSEFDYAIVPVGLDARYEFINRAGVIPYVRAGFRYPLAGTSNFDWHDSGGDRAFGGIKDRDLGAFGAVGIEFPQDHFGMEAGFDSSKITMTSSLRTANGTIFTSHSESVEPDQFLFTVYFRF
jgi:hypothetical protein